MNLLGFLRNRRSLRQSWILFRAKQLPTDRPLTPKELGILWKYAQMMRHIIKTRTNHEFSSWFNWEHRQPAEEFACRMGVRNAARHYNMPEGYTPAKIEAMATAVGLGCAYPGTDVELIAWRIPALITRSLWLNLVYLNSGLAADLTYHGHGQPEEDLYANAICGVTSAYRTSDIRFFLRYKAEDRPPEYHALRAQLARMLPRNVLAEWVQSPETLHLLLIELKPGRKVPNQTKNEDATAPF